MKKKPAVKKSFTQEEVQEIIQVQVEHVAQHYQRIMAEERKKKEAEFFQLRAHDRRLYRESSEQMRIERDTYKAMYNQLLKDYIILSPETANKLKDIMDNIVVQFQSSGILKGV